ncbi:YicC/YloC family endoribonuclease [Carboxydothermus hydrogenoformans]|uniref:YicC family protein n=1 Tax=Carboxydothermus hydrogenoformans (strain ATCC BAA-161 / DSM 6008 / Z-2901) TaxID=246194 RepID=Q3AC12_CARHZ|nr:YicC/YloC family endoribonuclease [Carboxydothermus hydrogenoformans]ABB14282.1 conserved hypothetical protein TIGR00255 [Carboxydothermus hydrogenoformans Z-2901]
MQSMTGYGRAESISEFGRILIELKGVNHKYLEINVKLPRRYFFLEDKIKKVVQSKVYRGKIDLYVTVEEALSKNVKIDENLVYEYYKELQKIGEALGIKADIEIEDLLLLPDIFKIAEPQFDEEEIWNYFLVPLNEALGKFIAMRWDEGKRLQDDISQKVTVIKNLVTEIESRAPEIPKEYREKLLNRLKDLGNLGIPEERILQEVLLYADKVSIDEEITRLKSHITAFLEVIHDSGPIGKKLDFIVQEMFRETNTIGAKANDLFISTKVVNLKSELEKIREQVQNIE